MKRSKDGSSDSTPIQHRQARIDRDDDSLVSLSGHPHGNSALSTVDRLGGPIVVTPGQRGIFPVALPDLSSQQVSAAAGLNSFRYAVTTSVNDQEQMDVSVRRVGGRDEAQRPWGLELSAHVLSSALHHSEGMSTDFARTITGAMGDGVTHSDTYYLREHSFSLAKQMVGDRCRRLARLEKNGGPNLESVISARHGSEFQGSQVTENLRTMTFLRAADILTVSTSWEDFEQRLVPSSAKGDARPLHAESLTGAVLSVETMMQERIQSADDGHRSGRNDAYQQTCLMDELAELVKRPDRAVESDVIKALTSSPHAHARDLAEMIQIRDAQANDPWYCKLAGAWNHRRLSLRAGNVLDTISDDHAGITGNLQALGVHHKRHQEAMGDLTVINHHARERDPSIRGGTIRAYATLARLLSDGVRDRGSVTNPSMTSRDEDERVLADISAGAVEGSLRFIARNGGDIPQREAFAFHQVLANAIRAVPSDEPYRFADLMDLSRQAIIDLACLDPEVTTSPLESKRRAADKLRGITLQATEDMVGMERPEATVSRVLVRFVDRTETDPRDAFRRRLPDGAPTGSPVWSAHQGDGAECRVWTAPIEEIFHLDHDPELLSLHLGYGGARPAGTVVIYDARHDRHSRIQPATRDTVADFAQSHAEPLIRASGVTGDARSFCRSAMSEQYDADYEALRDGPLKAAMAVSGKGLRDAATQAWMTANASPAMQVRWAAEVHVGANQHFRGGITQQNDVVGCREFFLFTGNRMRSNSIVLDAPLIDFSDHNGSVVAAGQSIDQLMSEAGNLSPSEFADPMKNPFAPYRPGKLTIHDAFRAH